MSELYQTLIERDVKPIFSDGGEFLHLDAPRGAIDENLLTQIQARRPLLRLLVKLPEAQRAEVAERVDEAEQDHAGSARWIAMSTPERNQFRNQLCSWFEKRGLLEGLDADLRGWLTATAGMGSGRSSWR